MRCHTSTIRTVTAAAILAGICTVVPATAQMHGITAVVDEFATMNPERLGQKAALEAKFLDSKGRAMTIGEAVSGKRPIIVNPGYFGCPGLCQAALNNVVRSLREAQMVPGRDFDLVTFSIDSREGPELAQKKKISYLSDLTKTESVAPDGTVVAAETVTDEAVAANWKFLTGAEDQILTLADSIGWRFRWSEFNRFDHPSTVVLLAPDGTVLRYLNTATMDGELLRRNVIEAGQGTVGSWTELILVSCLTFDPNTGAARVTAFTVLRIGGVVTVLALALMIFTLWRRERTKKAVPAVA